MLTIYRKSVLTCKLEINRKRRKRQQSGFTFTRSFYSQLPSELPSQSTMLSQFSILLEQLLQILSGSCSHVSSTSTRSIRKGKTKKFGTFWLLEYLQPLFLWDLLPSFSNMSDSHQKLYLYDVICIYFDHPNFKGYLIVFLKQSSFSSIDNFKIHKNS
jgi:hypothetical protein